MESLARKCPRQNASEGCSTRFQQWREVRKSSQTSFDPPPLLDDVLSNCWRGLPFRGERIRSAGEEILQIQPDSREQALKLLGTMPDDGFIGEFVEYGYYPASPV